MTQGKGAIGLPSRGRTVKKSRRIKMQKAEVQKCKRVQVQKNAQGRESETGQRGIGAKKDVECKCEKDKVQNGRSGKGQKCKRGSCKEAKVHMYERSKVRSGHVQKPRSATGHECKKATVPKYKSARSGKVHKGRKTRLREYRRARMPKC